MQAGLRAFRQGGAIGQERISVLLYAQGAVAKSETGAARDLSV